MGYLRNQWSALQVYLTDGRIPIDNDHSEQRIRPLAIGRNNWLFLGHPAAAPGRLQLFSLVSSAHRQHLVLQNYLEDVLSKLAEAQQRHPTALEPGCPYLLDLLPDRWAAAHPCPGRRSSFEPQTVSPGTEWGDLVSRTVLTDRVINPRSQPGDRLAVLGATSASVQRPRSNATTSPQCQSSMTFGADECYPPNRFDMHRWSPYSL